MQVQGAEDAKSKIAGVGGALQQTGKQADAAAVSAGAVQRNYGQAALGLSAAAASVTALAFQFDNLQKVQLRAESAAAAVTAAEATLASARRSLNTLTEKGVSTGGQYETAVLRLQAAQEQHNVALQRAQIAQGDVSQAQLQFALSVVPTLIGAVSSASLAVKGLGLGFNIATISSGVASLGVKAFGVATRLAQLAMGPLGWALLAIGTVFTLVATNAFGIRDAMDAFAKKVEEIFPILKPVFDFFRNIAAAIFPDTEKEAKSMEEQLGSSFTNVSGDVEQSANIQIASMDGLQSQFVDTSVVGSDSMKELAINTGASAQEIERAAKRARDALKSVGASVGPSPSAAKPSVQQLHSEFISTGTTSIASANNSVSAFTNLLGKGSNATSVDIKVFLDSQQIAAKVDSKTKTSMLAQT